MGSRGPAPAPTHLKLLKGTRPDRINTNEPKPKSKLPQCPSWLSPEAKKVWKKTLTELKHMGIASASDTDLLVAYCNAVVTYQKASELVDKSGLLIKGRRDGVVKNPAVQIQKDSAQLLKQLGAEFGLSPSSRSRISTGSEDSSLDSFLE